jgi:tRNA pseudouridine55 synthase
MGRRLGTRGHVAALRRLVVGPFDEKVMVTPDSMENAPQAGAGGLQPVEAALYQVPAFPFSEQDTARIRSGQAVLLRGRDAPVSEGAAYAVCAGVPVAIGRIDQGSFTPKRVFNLNENQATEPAVD